MSVFERKTYLLEKVFPSKGRGALEGIACCIAWDRRNRPPACKFTFIYSIDCNALNLLPYLWRFTVGCYFLNSIDVISCHARFVAHPIIFRRYFPHTSWVLFLTKENIAVCFQIHFSAFKCYYFWMSDWKIRWSPPRSRHPC